MCRNKSVCSELGENPDNWSFFSPLPPPVGFSEAHEIILSVIELISFGKIDLALEALHTSLEQEIKSWYQEHGQMSGSHRFRALGGVGEPTICVVGPAVANAISAAIGRPVRNFPLSKEGLSLA